MLTNNNQSAIYLKRIKENRNSHQKELLVGMRLRLQNDRDIDKLATSVLIALLKKIFRPEINPLPVIHTFYLPIQRISFDVGIAQRHR